MVHARALIVAAAISYGAMLYLALRAKRGYIAELHSSLEAGTLSLGGLDKLDRFYDAVNPELDWLILRRIAGYEQTRRQGPT